MTSSSFGDELADPTAESLGTSGEASSFEAPGELISRAESERADAERQGLLLAGDVAASDVFSEEMPRSVSGGDAGS